MSETNKIRTMRDMFSHMGDVEYSKFKRGRARTINQFYQTIVKPNELDVDVVRRWWDLLKKYCDPQNKTFIAFVRRYGNCPKDRTFQRRGFFTKYRDGTGYVFCDNSLADYFYTMAKAHFVPEYDDFVGYIISRQFPSCIRGVREEYETDNWGFPLYQAYKYRSHSKPRGLYCRWRSADGKQHDNKIWYLAHILDVDDPRDYPGEYKLNADRIFLQGDRKDWCRHKGVDFPYRYIDANLSDGERKILTAHFIRLVCPMNYFLTPQNRINNREVQNLLVEGKVFRRGIQELPEMKMFMRQKQLERFGRVFEEYEDLAMAIKPRVEAQNDFGEKVIDLRYCPSNEELSGNGTIKQQMNSGPEKQRRKRNKVVSQLKEKARIKIPRWARYPSGWPYRMIRAFLELSMRNVEGHVDVETLRKALVGERMDVNALRRFTGAFGSLQRNSEKSYGRVFMKKGGNVSLVPEVRDLIVRYREQFLVN